MNFADLLAQDCAWKLTENGQPALNTTFDECLDLFSTIGALRKRSDFDIELKFAHAYGENPLLAVKTLFYARDIEQGLGERRVFRIGLKWLARSYPEVVAANLQNIVKYGRFDDLYELVDTPVEAEMFKFMHYIVRRDERALAEGGSVTLAGKWLKSVNSKHAKTRALGLRTAKAFGMCEANYRRLTSALRKAIKIVESDMSRNNWSEIDYNTVPGGAMKMHNAAFRRHDGERFDEYIFAVNAGQKIKVNGKEVEAKINTKHLFPYEILEQMSIHGRPFSLYSVNYDAACEAMWKGLDDWIQGAQSNTIIMADTSGSMNGRPLATSVGLGIYFAERNTGPFHNRFMTFSSKPSWITLPEKGTLADKVHAVPNICDNTNIEAAFDLILDTAVKHHVKPEDMPQNLVIISDMEFDVCVDNNTTSEGFWYRTDRTGVMTFYDSMKAKFAAHGYELPNITFWNVNARHDTFHTQQSTPHVRMVSGQSPSVFKSLIDGKAHTPYEFMLEVLNSERYDSVVLR